MPGFPGCRRAVRVPSQKRSSTWSSASPPRRRLGHRHRPAGRLRHERARDRRAAVIACPLTALAGSKCPGVTTPRCAPASRKGGLERVDGLPVGGMSNILNQACNRMQYRFGREPEGSSTPAIGAARKIISARLSPRAGDDPGLADNWPKTAGNIARIAAASTPSPLESVGALSCVRARRTAPSTTVLKSSSKSFQVYPCVNLSP